MTRVLFVGDRPSKLNQSQEVAFLGAACWPRLMNWIERIGIKDFSIVNSDTSDCWHVILMHDGPIIALGEVASKRLTEYDFIHYKLPHPSGLNRKNNDKAYISRQIAKAKGYITHYKELLCRPNMEL